MKRNYFIVGLIFLIFFVISLLTNILGPIIPDLIGSFNLSLAMAGFLPFSFFVAYGVMSIPAGVLVEKYKEKKTMLVSFGLAALGAFMFALFPTFSVALPSLFTIGIGMAMLQVAINPLLRTAGGEEHFAFNSVFAQLIFGLASFISPHIYTYLVTHLKSSDLSNILLQTLNGIVPAQLPWVSLYWVFSVVALLMIVVIALSRIPKVALKDDEKAGTVAIYKDLLKNRTVILFFVGVFAYVGTEQGIANWMSKFLATYHSFDPQTEGATAVSYFWGLLTAGCLLGMLLLKVLDSRIVLKVFTLMAIVSLTVALFGSARIAYWAFPMCGFFLSVMWSVVFSLALNSLDKHHGSFSGILCTGIVGGAIVPVVIGWLGDMLGLRAGMFFLYITLAYVLSVGFWAKPLITNKTIKFKE